MPGWLTFGELADQLGTQLYRLDNALRRGLLPVEPTRCGRTRVVREDQVEEIRVALISAGVPVSKVPFQRATA